MPEPSQAKSCGPCITTNGMFIIDDIIDQDGKVHKDVPGGGGMFAMLGGCIVSLNSVISKSLQWIVDCGYDFPSELTETIEGWGSGVHFRHDSSRETTRGWNLYKGKEFREFKYINKKKTIDVFDWEELGSTQFANIKCVHLICSGLRCQSLIDQMKVKNCRPNVIVWEPVPDLCNPSGFEEMKEILSREADYSVVFSPNAEEGARLFGDKEPFTVEEIEKCIWRFDTVLADKQICVLRCGKLGSVVLSARDINTGNRTLQHLPAYHKNTPEKVIDPTGAGNAYLGGFCVGYTLTGSLSIASICGNVAAGCVVEQIGVPQFESKTREWNGLTFHQRLRHYIEDNSLLTLYSVEETYGRLRDGGEKLF